MDTDRYIKIRRELSELKEMIQNVNNQMQELRESIRGTPNSTKMLSVSEPYVHPWWQYQRDGLVFGGNNLGNEVETSRAINLD
jgi:hypothetical protein